MAIALVEERKACGLWQWLALSRLFVYLFFRFSHEPTQLKSKEMSSVCDIRLSTSITLKAENWQVPLQCLVFFSSSSFLFRSDLARRSAALERQEE